MAYMTWLEIPFLLGMCGFLTAILIKLDDRIDKMGERLATMETLIRLLSPCKFAQGIGDRKE
jgi:hypothetical protein